MRPLELVFAIAVGTAVAPIVSDGVRKLTSADKKEEHKLLHLVRELSSEEREALKKELLK